MPAAGGTMPERNYGRKYMRIKPESPAYADVTIVRIGESKVVAGTARVRLVDLSPGGLRFVSPLSLPIDDRVLLEFRFAVLEHTFKLNGRIIHKTGMEVNEYEYGFCFSEADEHLKTCLKKLFNNRFIRLDKHIVFLKFT